MPTISTKIRGRPRARSAASSRAQDVVSVSSMTSETDAATRVTISAAECRPWAVNPSGCPCQCHSGSTTSPVVMIDSVAGRTTTPVKIGTNSHTRFRKTPSGRRLASASATVAAYIASSVGMVRTNDATTSSTRTVTTLTRPSTRWR